MVSRFRILFRQLNFNLFLYLVFTKFSEKFLQILFGLNSFYSKRIFSQGGEDFIIDHLFKDKTNGIFVDVGCNQPIEFNNTFGLYLRGWKGINIDGNQDLIDLYSKYRPNDISISKLISDTETELTFFVSKSNKVSTIDEKFYNDNNKSFEYNSNDFVKAKTVRLDKILREFNFNHIDLLSIDVEGHDLNVLSSINLDNIRPDVICIEDHQFNIDNLFESYIYIFLKEKKYKLKYYAISSCYYVNDDKL